MTTESSRPALASQTALPEQPMVSVAITAYKSASTIVATLEGVLAQCVDFPVEIVVGDDASPDNTVEVVRSMMERYPGVIRLLARPQNLGIQRNYHQTFLDCRGKYIAWLDADDLWTHPDKLQRQVEAMEADPGVGICGHFVRWVTPDKEVVRARYPEMAAGRYGLQDILRKDFLPSPSVVFRRGLEKLLPEWYFDAAPLTDWPLYTLAARQSDILLLDETFADYRLMPNSNFWGQGEGFWYRLDIKFYGFVMPHLSATMQQFAKEQQGLRYERLAYFLRQQGDFSGSLQAAWQAVTTAPLLRNTGKWKGLLAALLARMGIRRSP
jgi:glycosyltransferase involved in cell wall biosynthesis